LDQKVLRSFLGGEGGGGRVRDLGMLFEGLKIGRGWNVWRQRQRQKWKGVVTEM
jgi:hypothetical protein